MFKSFFIILFTFSALTANNISLPTSFASKFVQTITNPKGKVLKYTGVLAYSDTYFVKWNYQTPTKREICSSGQFIIIVDHDLEQISKYETSETLNIIEIVSKAKKVKKNIWVTKKDNKLYTIRVDSKNKINSIAYIDKLDNKVQILFKKMTYRNKSLPSKLMLCKEPKNYDIIQ
jgi:outer membrane lipoprotein carrier protein